MKTLLFLILSLFVQSTYGQYIQDILQLDTLISIQSASIDLKYFPMNNNMGNFTTDNEFNFLFSDNKKDSVCVKSINTATGGQNTYYLLFDKAMYDPGRMPYIKAMRTNGSIVILLLNYSSREDALAFFNKNVSGNYTLQRIKRLGLPYDDIFLSGNNVELVVCYNYPDIARKHKTEISKYDLNKDTVCNTIFPECRDIIYSCFRPFNMADMSGRNTLFSNTCIYELTVYDSGMHATKLRRKANDWKSIDTTLLTRLKAKLNNKTRLLIDSIQFYDTNTNRIFSSSFINDSTILVCYLKNKMKQGKAVRINYADIWVHKNNTWLLKYKDLKDSMPGENDMYTAHNMPLLPDRHCTYTANNKIVQVRISTGINPIGYSAKGYATACDKYFNDHDPKIDVYVFSFRSH